MITLTLPDWFVVFLIANLAMVFGLTLYYSVRRYRWMPRHRAPPFIFRCSVCGHVYLDRRNVPMAECSNCGNMNENVKSF
ncbi:MAG: hypothetical protein KBC66_02165 [Kiritimatiellae bacterium]|jgi:rubrerythrin|nr:hypothetical protein [Kiritimatiellia bacterium]NLD89875.1 DUF4175 domain-containing protein [Lentisphaerota bacterium]HOU22193.1 hypothetical protein [Kiritimatiellia bacterium]HPC18951.1 hypothetical protein [Kiritimatiellia bacterium]HQN80526.1 hypothetical protein [Kiritimatiellia bacterium]